MSRAFALFFLLAGAAVLAAALASQYWGGLLPCELCLAERWPWYAAVAVAVVAALAGDRAAAWLAPTFLVIFVASSGLAFYHVGVEQHWFAGPSACTAAGAAPQTIAALRAQLEHQQAVRCDAPAWTWFGVSLAGWNLLASLIMAGVAVAGLVHSPPPYRRTGGSRGTAP